jgi:hypothetical protein
MHILMGDAVNPKEAARLGLVYESVSGKALDRAMEIARRLASRPPESVAAIKRLVRNATETPLAQGLALERNLFLRLCISDAGLARMRSYEAANITSPASSAPPSPASQGVARGCGRGPISRLRLPWLFSCRQCTANARPFQEMSPVRLFPGTGSAAIVSSVKTRRKGYN